MELESLLACMEGWWHIRALLLCIVEKLGGIMKFAPIRLTNMFNSGGTIQEMDVGICPKSQLYDFRSLPT